MISELGDDIVAYADEVCEDNLTDVLESFTLFTYVNNDFIDDQRDGS